MGRRLAAVDAQTYWMSAKIPSDQFLLYGFAGAVDLDAAVARLGARARGSTELRLRVRDGSPLTYPHWVTANVSPNQFVMHAAGSSWAECLAVVAGLLSSDQLDPRITAWRIHIFPAVENVPGAGLGTVAVVQVAHALGDGIRSSALAAWLFGRRAFVPNVPAPEPFPGLRLPWRGYAAARAHRRLVRDTSAGSVPPPADPRPALRSNARPEGLRSIRTVVMRRAEMPGPTVTVGALAAISEALAGHLREFGDDPSLLGAEVPMAKAGDRLAHNNFGNVGVGLYPDLAFDARTLRVAEDLKQRRRRAAHPAMTAANRASAVVPAWLLRYGVGKFDPTLCSPTVTGNTVVSSVNRGPADLRFGNSPVVLTAGFPGLSPMMGVTHGVHGIGDAIAVSVHAAESAIGDIDSYIERLEAALRGQHP